MEILERNSTDSAANCTSIGSSCSRVPFLGFFPPHAGLPPDMFDPRLAPAGLPCWDDVPPLVGLCPGDTSPLVILLLGVAVAPGIPPVSKLLLDIVARPRIGLFPGLLLGDDWAVAGLLCDRGAGFRRPFQPPFPFLFPFPLAPAFFSWRWQAIS